MARDVRLGGPKRPSHSIASVRKWWAPGNGGVGIPIPVPDIQPEDYLISVEGRVRATGTVSEATDWTILPAGGAVVSPTRGFSADDFLVKWYDRHQQSPVLSVQGDAGAGRGTDWTPGNAPGRFGWWRSEDIPFSGGSARSYMESDTTYGDPFPDIRRYSTWRGHVGGRIANPSMVPSASPVNTSVNGPDFGELGAHIVNVNGRNFRCVTMRSNPNFPTPITSSGLRTNITVGEPDVNPPWVWGVVFRSRDPLENGAAHIIGNWTTAPAPGGIAIQVSGGTTGEILVTEDGMPIVGPDAVANQVYVLTWLSTGTTGSEMWLEDELIGTADTNTNVIAAGANLEIGAGFEDGVGGGPTDIFEFAIMDAASVNEAIGLRSNWINYATRKFGFVGR